jgi:hypothetical protein
MPWQAFGMTGRSLIGRDAPYARCGYMALAGDCHIGPMNAAIRWHNVPIAAAHEG